MAEERCVHDLMREQCSLCRPTPVAPPDRRVWVLPTSEVFHERDCYMFDAVHEANLVRDIPDNEPAPLTVAEALDIGLRPCERCAPHVR
ncbi:MAG TPA: hypothetical protein VNQ77_00570 [Frankiaceae bacterium]|nr:hypothetical protein [Frankiaceae bacterium]